mmetsp:Transcript_4629/g.12881  ORF Transcript_4629/g.12881 Transcript_4629/m.12881 type:complete len:104 (-) Transcript_4629:13-324(-)
MALMHASGGKKGQNGSQAFGMLQMHLKDQARHAAWSLKGHNWPGRPILHPTQGMYALTLGGDSQYIGQRLWPQRSPCNMLEVSGASVCSRDLRLTATSYLPVY